MNIGEVYKWWDTFKSDNNLVEIRIVGTNAVYSGYFKDINKLIEEVQKYENLGNVYFTINQINESCYGREQKDVILKKPKNTTTDKEIVVRDWVYIDFDAKRISGVNATDEEVAFVKQKANQVFMYLKDNGFNNPIIIFSGNGVHFYYRCAMLSSDDNNNMVKRFLNTLNMLFGDEHTEIDCSVFNPSRISRLPGTYSAKGSVNDSDRPRRMCSFVQVPDVKITEIEYFRKIANIYPEDNVSPQTFGYSGRFDLDEFLNKHNVNYRTENTSDGTKYILDHCFFNHNHTGKDAVLFKRSNGAIAYHCFHNSCSQYSWKDVRLLFEPDAYDRKTYNEFSRKRDWNNRFDRDEKIQKFEAEKENEKKGKKWLNMSDISYVDFSSLISIKTGCDLLDKKIVGLFMGDVTILSGLSGSGKSNWLGTIMLNAIQQGFNVAAWSGELQDFRFQSWIMMMAAGKNHTKLKQGYDDFYYAPKHIVEKISKWTENKLLLYNNNYGNKFDQLYEDIKECVNENNVRLLVLDNLMALDIDNFDGEKYSKQTKFINTIKEFAKSKNIHIIIVCHPRKEGGFLRMESISGTADIFNLSDNVFIIHRVGTDFEKRGAEFFGSEIISPFKFYSSVVEVCKNRSLGVKDFLVGMYYEKESKRMKNSIEETIHYGWEDNGEPIPMPIQSFAPNTSFDNSNNIVLETYDNEENFESNNIYGLPF